MDKEQDGHLLAKEVLRKGYDLGMNRSRIASHVGTNAYTLKKWASGDIAPRKSSVKKIKKAIELIDAGKLSDTKDGKQEPVYIDMWDELTDEQQAMYVYVRRIEKKHKSLGACPSDDPDFIKLREQHS